MLIRNRININNFLKIVKIAVGSSVAILIANFLGLAYSASAGIITLLSIQDTKKETLRVAGKRFIALIMAVVIAYALFNFFGYHPVTFGLFLFLFVFFSYLLKISEGIPMCSVLVSHFLIEKNMKGDFILNEFFIFFIGILIGIVLNLYIPGNLNKVKAQIAAVEDKIKNILDTLAVSIISNEFNQNVNEGYKEHEIDKDLIELQKLLNQGFSIAYENMNNTLLVDTQYYLQYFTMRKNQYECLVHMRDRISRLFLVPRQAEPIGAFFNKISFQFHEHNNARMLLQELDNLMLSFKEEPNPKTREEFENRAVLYLLLYDLKNFLNIKKDFVDGISAKQIERFWNACKIPKN